MHCLTGVADGIVPAEAEPTPRLRELRVPADCQRHNCRQIQLHKPIRRANALSYKSSIQLASVNFT